jgi:hypothetical protein
MLARATNRGAEMKPAGLYGPAGLVGTSAQLEAHVEGELERPWNVAVSWIAK